MTTTPPRVFNEIIDLGEYYLKISKDICKMNSEINFYNSVPMELLHFYPEISPELVTIGEKAGYKIKKIPVPDASYFAVSGALENMNYFIKLISHLNVYLKSCPKKIVEADVAFSILESEVIQKDLGRLELIKSLPEAAELIRIAQRYGFRDLDHYLSALHQKLIQAHHKIKVHELSFSHGDMCLSNILFFEEQLYLIDPKGKLPNQESIRSPYYDYAKLSQCFYGNYDYINLLRFDVSRHDSFQVSDENTAFLKDLFHGFCRENKINEEYLLVIQATFFLSMIPLHSESFVKMRAFLISSIQSMEKVTT